MAGLEDAGSGSRVLWAQKGISSEKYVGADLGPEKVSGWESSFGEADSMELRTWWH